MVAWINGLLEMVRSSINKVYFENATVGLADNWNNDREGCREEKRGMKDDKFPFLSSLLIRW